MSVNAFPSSIGHSKVFVRTAPTCCCLYVMCRNTGTGILGQQLGEYSSNMVGKHLIKSVRAYKSPLLQGVLVKSAYTP